MTRHLLTRSQTAWEGSTEPCPLRLPLTIPMGFLQTQRTEAQSKGLERDHRLRGGPLEHSTQKVNWVSTPPLTAQSSRGWGDRMSTSQWGVLPTSLRSTSNIIFKPISSKSMTTKAVSPTSSFQGHPIQFLMRGKTKAIEAVGSTSKILFRLENRSSFVLVKHQLLCSL